MTAFDRTGFWRITKGGDAIMRTEQLGDDDGRQLYGDGAPDVIRVEVHAAGGFAATQHSGGDLTLPSGQVIPHGVSTLIAES